MDNIATGDLHQQMSSFKPREMIYWKQTAWRRARCKTIAFTKPELTPQSCLKMAHPLLCVTHPTPVSYSWRDHLHAKGYLWPVRMTTARNQQWSPCHFHWFISNSPCVNDSTTGGSIPAAKIQSAATLTRCLGEKYSVPPARGQVPAVAMRSNGVKWSTEFRSAWTQNSAIRLCQLMRIPARWVHTCTAADGTAPTFSGLD